ncbi:MULTISPECIES: hypothetical protein [Arthrobacter]|uniref:Uncharacterized protein n=1 Tax=Arthrobacter terricola TaxID=2547396 RepID=A0A4R5K9K9_9MICC|nr:MULTISPECIES: hypothetical protein [Arthrobacter]MBT8162921.1 hypothetical protein [Arthrobacter sp. GN70]TDF91666.1 hypothetical protein E1809_20320 [Arthrobacter terricola]
MLGTQEKAGTTTAPRQFARVTAATSLFTFYDIESLSNVFSVTAYTPRPAGTPDDLEVFHLVDDTALAGQLERQALLDAVRAGNPGLPPVRLLLHNLRTVPGTLRLAQLVGLSDAEQVCHAGTESSYPPDLRPVCDTDPVYDARRHPFLAGYNSMNYDTTMLALYLAEVFSGIAGHRAQLTHARHLVAGAATPEDRSHAHSRLRTVLGQRPAFDPPTAAAMRAHNDQLFDPRHIDYMPGYLGWDTPAGNIRRAMIQSGRHLDVARLNEHQQRVGLKRLLGMLGHQIRESGKLGHDSVITTAGELYELLAYNVADCVGLAQLFKHPAYSSAFDLKAGLLAQYTETVFNRDGSVRRDRLAIDSSSAKFVGRILAPHAPLNDIEAVSFLYPAPEVAAERNIAQSNVLDECVRFFEDRVAPDRHSNPAQAEAHRGFMQVAAYYRAIEGQNFNESEEYRELYGRDATSLPDIPKTPNNLPYFTADGTPSPCFATFSTGGIHGAEADTLAYRIEQLEHQQQARMIEAARRVYPDARDFVAEARRQHGLLTLPDGSTVDKHLVLLGSDPVKVKYRRPAKADQLQAAQLARARELVPDPAVLLATRRPEAEALKVRLDDGTVLDGKVVLAVTSAAKAAYRDEPAKKPPVLFVGKDDGSTRLHPRYARTSAARVTHEDFTSYYPNLLRNMRAFWNPELGEDRYATIFFRKEDLGREMKQPALSPEEKARLTTLRNGTKLILNAASGAGDASHKNPIRMNNRIISMRIIGQLFSWRIGQAQTLAGARIISTNTDGLYSVLDQETNDRVLAEQAALIGVDIEPEPMFLISKDSNNRMELSVPPEGSTLAESRIITASGGTLACHAGPRPDKSLAHPAVIDHALARYLQAVAGRGEAALSEPFDPVLGRRIIEDALDLQDPVATALLFQNVIAASRGSITYPFAAAPPDTNVADPNGDVPDSSRIRDARPLQMVNRVFVVRPGTPDAVSLHNAGAWKVPPATLAKRRSGEARIPAADPVASGILAHHGWASTMWMKQQNQALTLVPEGQDVLTRRINGIDPAWSMVICNDDLRAMDRSRLIAILCPLDLPVYVRMLDETFSKNWKNA